MLEALVSSKIRRAVFEYLLLHSTDRFYLRGLAKELGLSVSPLRRELKRLERSGMLRSFQEGNMVFYAANASSPAFLQLQQAGLSPRGVSTHAISPQIAGPNQGATPQSEPVQPPMIPHVGSEVVQGVPARVRSVNWHRSMLVAAAGLAMALIVVGVGYVSITHQRMAARLLQQLSARSSSVTVMMPASSSGTMRGARWRIVPGAVGGFGGGVDSESY